MHQRHLPFDTQDIDWTPKPPPSLDGIIDIAYDVETDGLDWRNGNRPVGIAVAWEGHSQYVPFAHRGGGNLDETACKRWAERELRGKRLHGLNLKFDAHMTREWGVNLEEQGCTLHDVGHKAALLDDHRKSSSLEAVAQDWLGRGKVTDIDPKRIAEYHAGQVDEYARTDVELPLELNAVMMPQLESEGLLEVLKLEDDCTWPVVDMEREGAPIDEEKLDRWVKESEQELLKLLWNIYRESGVKVEPRRPNTLIKLFGARKLQFVNYTPTGAPSFTDEILGLYDDPVIQMVRRARRLESLRAKYLLAYQKAVSGGKLPFNLHQLRGSYEDGEAGTISGRFSSSNKNIQQVMAVEKQKENLGDSYIIRELFIPESGWFFSSDASQIEYRLFAHYASSPKILEAYERDPTVSFHLIVWDIVKRFKEIKYKPLKNFNFAKIYGAGIKKISMMLGISEEEAEILNAVYNKQFPEVNPLLSRASRKAKERGYVKTILGRRTRFPEKKRLHKALNGIIQGSAADIMKRKLVELYRERKRLGIKMRFTVHDEVCGDTPDVSTGHEVLEVLNAQSYKLKVPILWDMALGENWANGVSLTQLPKTEDHVPGQFPRTVRDPSRGDRAR